MTAGTSRRRSRRGWCGCPAPDTALPFDKCTGLYKVSAPFYSGRIDLPRSCPVVASYGGRDLSTRGYPAKLVADLDALDVPHDVVTYPQAGHSFFTHTTGLMGRLAQHTPIHAEYHEASAADAHRRIVAFFREHLDG